MGCGGFSARVNGAYAVKRGEKSVPLRCPECQGVLRDNHRFADCPYCGAPLADLTPLEIGLLSDFGVGMIGCAVGLLLSIVLLAYVSPLRSSLTVVASVFGCWLVAWGRAKTLTAQERFSWERWWIIAFCGTIGAFVAALLGLSWQSALVLAGVGLMVGYFLCRQAAIQWRREQKR